MSQHPSLKQGFLADESAPQPADRALPSASPTGQMVRVQVWDLPLRVFHWSLALCVCTALITGWLGGEWMELHGKAGLGVAGLLGFRLVWGIVGSTHARFTSFAPSPRAILAYLKGQWTGVGHNPLGALSVFALLGFLAIQVGSGLLGNDEIAFSGPLASLVSEDLSIKATGWHRRLAWAMYLLTGLHVAAVIFYVHVKRHNILRPMLTGSQEVSDDTPQPRKAWLISLILALVLGLAVGYASSGAWIQQSAPQAESGAVQQASPIPTTAATASAPSW
jgi:cytochrome b